MVILRRGVEFLAKILGIFFFLYKYVLFKIFKIKKLFFQKSKNKKNKKNKKENAFLKIVLKVKIEKKLKFKPLTNFFKIKNRK